MKLVHPSWNHQIVLDEGSSMILSFENSHTFRNHIKELKSQLEGEDGRFVLSEKGEEIPLKDNVILIPSVFSLDLDDKRINSRLQSMLKAEVVSEDLYLKSQEILSMIEKYAEDVTDSFPYRIRYAEPDPVSLVKFLGFEAEYDYTDELDKILEYMNLIHSFCNISAFFIIGMTLFFSVDEIRMLVDNCKSLKHSVVFLEGVVSEEILKESGIKSVIIDADECEIFSEG